MNCDNCSKVFYDDYDYCPECGQSAKEKLSLKVLFSETFGNYFSVDAKIFKSIFPLIAKPGFLAKEFVEGKRQKYLHPARFYLFVSIIFFFFYSLGESKFVNINSNDDAMEELTLDQEDVDVIADINNNEVDTINIFGFINGVIVLNRQVVDSLERNNASLDEKISAIGYKGGGRANKFFYTQVYQLYSKDGEGFGKKFDDTLPISLFFMLPIFALILKLFHYKKGSYSKHLVFSFSLFTFIFSLMFLIMLTSFVINVSAWVYFAAILLTFIYLVIGIKNFYAQKTFRSLWKSAGVLAIFNIFVVPVSFVIMAIITFIIF